MKRRRSYAFSHRGAHFCLRGGWGKEGRFDVAARSESPKPTCQNHKQQLLRPRSGPSKAAHTRTTRVKEQQVLSKYRKKESNTKYYWNYYPCQKKIETTACTWQRRVICRACTRLCLACVPVSIFLARVVEKESVHEVVRGDNTT